MIAHAIAVASALQNGRIEANGCEWHFPIYIPVYFIVLKYIIEASLFYILLFYMLFQLANFFEMLTQHKIIDYE